jgi:hypothetical protein
MDYDFNDDGHLDSFERAEGLNEMQREDQEISKGSKGRGTGPWSSLSPAEKWIIVAISVIVWLIYYT